VGAALSAIIRSTFRRKDVALTADDFYRREVVTLLTQELIGELDDEAPRVDVADVRDVTPTESDEFVLVLNVVLRIEGRSGERQSAFPWREWVEYTDSSPESMAAGLAVLVRTDIREELATSR
jgi:hypothetical protein